MMLLSQRAKALSPSPTLALDQKVRAMRAQGIPIISLVAGEPDFDTPSTVKQAAVQALADGHTKYTDVSGILALRILIAKQLKNAIKVDYEPGQVIVTAGAKQALYNALQVLVGPGDEVIIPSPYWVSYPAMVKLAGATPVILPTREKDHFVPQSGELERVITPKTRVLILNSPNNPTGATYSRQALAALGRVALAHRLIIISDEIYSKLTYGVRHVSPASLSRPLAERTIVVDGMSKAFAMTGWRMGYAAGPLEVIKAMAALQSHSTSNASSLAQHASISALKKSHSSVEKMRKAFQQRRDFVLKELKKMSTWSCLKPTGAFYAFINIQKTGLSSQACAERLLTEARVALIPGVEFGAEGYLRLSYAASMDTLRAAMKQIQKVFL